MEGEVDPVRDLDIINEELRLKDEEQFNKIYEELERKCVRGGEKKLKPEYVSYPCFLSKPQSMECRLEEHGALGLNLMSEPVPNISYSKIFFIELLIVTLKIFGFVRFLV